MHAFLQLFAERPQLLAEHVDAYADLIAAEAPRNGAADGSDHGGVRPTH